MTGANGDDAAAPKDAVARLRALAMQPGHSDPMQRAIAELLDVASIEPRRRDRARIDAQIEVGTQALSAAPPNVVLASAMVEQARLRIFARTSIAFAGILRDTDGDPRAILDRAIPVSFALFLLTTVVFDGALAILVAFVACLKGVPFDSLACKIPLFEMNYILAVFFGYVGGLTSLMFRLSAAAEDNALPVRVLFFIQVFKPLLGSAFAGVIYCMLQSKVVLPDVPFGDSSYFFCFIGFLSGFSERFAPDLLGRAENRYKPPAAKPPAEPAKPPPP